jgi:hypothetical protein
MKMNCYLNCLNYYLMLQELEQVLLLVQELLGVVLQEPLEVVLLRLLQLLMRLL